MTTTMNLSRTDLAVETAEALPTGRDMFAPGTGVTKSECLLCGCLLYTSDAADEL